MRLAGGAQDLRNDNGEFLVLIFKNFDSYIPDLKLKKPSNS